MFFKVLYNNCYGAFNFSDTFSKEYEKRAGRAINSLLLGKESIRCDPIAIAIFEEKGSEWCSGMDAMLEIREVPSVFEKYWEIDDYLGDEHVRILVSEALADILHTYMQTGDRAALDQQYATIMAAAG